MHRQRPVLVTEQPLLHISRRRMKMDGLTVRAPRCLAVLHMQKVP